MPEQTYMVVDPRRDHSIRVPRPDLSASLGSPNACNQCHTDKSVEWSVRAVEEWYGSEREMHYGEALFAGRMGMPGAGRKLVALSLDESQPGLARATALALLSRYPGRSADDVIAAGLIDQDPLVRYGALRAIEGMDPYPRIERVVPVLSDTVKAIRVEAGRLLSPIPTTSLADERRYPISRAVEEYVEAERFNLDRPESHLNLGLLSTWRGQYDEAESAYQTALDIYPGQIQAFINLADLYRLQGREHDAERVLNEALEYVPEAATIHHALGLLLARTNRLPKALEKLERAARLRPDNARFAYVYAIGLHSAGDTLGALATLEQTLLKNPYDRDVLMALSTIRSERAPLTSNNELVRFH
jgi:Flp pilus assembly protein TadD